MHGVALTEVTAIVAALSLLNPRDAARLSAVAPEYDKMMQTSPERLNTQRDETKRFRDNHVCMAFASSRLCSHAFMILRCA
jgi:hypothetical protein